MVGGDGPESQNGARKGGKRGGRQSKKIPHARQVPSRLGRRDCWEEKESRFRGGRREKRMRRDRGSVVGLNVQLDAVLEVAMARKRAGGLVEVSMEEDQGLGLEGYY